VSINSAQKEIEPAWEGSKKMACRAVKPCCFARENKSPLQFEKRPKIGCFSKEIQPLWGCKKCFCEFSLQIFNDSGVFLDYFVLVIDN
jgi:hypothetical protein